MGILHLTSVFSPAAAWHFIRDDVTAWTPERAENILNITGFTPRGFTEIACSVVPGDGDGNGNLHVVAIGTAPAGQLLHTLRVDDGSWPFPMGDVQAQTSQHGPNIGAVAKVACAASDSGDLQLCVLDQEHRLWHTIRTADGNWPFPMGDVQAQTSQRGPNVGGVAQVACAASLGQLHLCVVDQTGNLWHTIRAADGTWPFPMGDVQAQTSVHGPRIGQIVNTSCATDQDGNLHLCVVNQAGVLWHTIRSFDGTWRDPFGDVLSQTGDIGLPLDQVTCTMNFNNGLHVMVTNRRAGAVTDGGLWHAIRADDGSWTKFEDVKALLPGSGDWLKASISHYGPPLT
jgi:hypothetical protein